VRAGRVGRRHDDPGAATTILVPPPEAAAEGFVRQVAAGRYEAAAAYLSADAAAHVDHESLARLRRNLEASAGDAGSVTARPGRVEEDEAEATAVVDGRDGRITLRLSLSLQKGLWRIEGIRE
jgi:hypothetical protein